jgi:predicted outer membrane protein
MPHVNPIQVQKYLKGVDYPASKAALLEKARSMGADENVCASLEQLPDEDYQTPADVSQAFGRLDDTVGTTQDAGSGQGRDKGAGKQRAAQGASKQQPGRHTGGDEFLVEAMQDAMAEIQVCEMALEKSQNEDVKAFAQLMIDEHGRMGREFEQLAGRKQLDVPRQIRAEQEMTVDEFASLEGRDFEQRWIQYNIDVHERDIKVFRHYAQEEEDPDIRQIAQQGGDMLMQHLKLAHDVGKKLARP